MPHKVLRLRVLFFLALILFVNLTRSIEIQVMGQMAFSTHQIESYLGFPEKPEEWTKEDWESWSLDAALLVSEAYRDQGYFEAKAHIVPPNFDTVLTHSLPICSVFVSEGPRYLFDSIQIRLPEGMYPQFDKGNLRSRTGRIYSKETVFRDRRDLLKFYGNSGFLKAQAAESLFYDTSRNTVGVQFQMTPGQALVLDTLILRILREGDTTGRPGITSSELLANLFPPHRGDTLSLKVMSTYERKLKSTRSYNYVRLRDSLLESGGSIMVLSAEEKVPGEIDGSLFWENLFGLGGSLGWSHANLGGKLQESRVNFTFAERKQALSLGYASPLLFGSSIRFDNDFLINWQQDGKLVIDSGWFNGDFDVSNQAKLSRQILPWMRLVSGAELIGTSEKTDSVSRLRDFHLNYINSLFISKMDDLVNPTLGVKWSLTWGNGGPIVRQSELSIFQSRHNWLEMGSAGFLPVANWFVLAMRFDAGRFFQTGGLNSERFFLGGGRSIRNQDWRHLCPEGGPNACLKENLEPAYFLGALEARLQPFQPNWVPMDGYFRYLVGLQVVPFVDYGNIWEVGKNLTQSGKGLATGMGIRYVFLSLFNLRIDYAWDPRDPGNSDKRRFIFDLIQAF